MLISVWRMAKGTNFSLKLFSPVSPMWFRSRRRIHKDNVLNSHSSFKTPPQSHEIGGFKIISPPPKPVAFLAVVAYLKKNIDATYPVS
jgi:hypothetical protein